MSYVKSKPLTHSGSNELLNRFIARQRHTTVERLLFTPPSPTEKMLSNPIEKPKT